MTRHGSRGSCLLHGTGRQADRTASAIGNPVPRCRALLAPIYKPRHIISAIRQTEQHRSLLRLRVTDYRLTITDRTDMPPTADRDSNLFKVRATTLLLINLRKLRGTLFVHSIVGSLLPMRSVGQRDISPIAGAPTYDESEHLRRPAYAFGSFAFGRLVHRPIG